MAKKQLDIQMKVGLFVTIGLALIMLSILVLGGANSFLTRQNHYFIHYDTIDGLVNGAKVVLNGITVGTVDGADFDTQRGDIKVNLKIATQYANWIRKDSEAELRTQGLLGDKFIALSVGTPESPVLSPNSEIDTRPTKDLTQVISRSDQLMVSLTSIANNLDHLIKAFEAKHRSEIFFDGLANSAKNLSSASQKLSNELDDLQIKKATRNLNGILEKINNGSGTLGALINDPSLYDDAKAFMGGANRNRIMRNLIRKTIKDNEKTNEKPEKK